MTHTAVSDVILSTRSNRFIWGRTPSDDKLEVVAVFDVNNRTYVEPKQRTTLTRSVNYGVPEGDEGSKNYVLTIYGIDCSLKIGSRGGDHLESFGEYLFGEDRDGWGQSVREEE